MTSNDSNGESGRDGPRRQHYVSAMLLKQWGDCVEGRDTVIGRFDMYTRLEAHPLHYLAVTGAKAPRRARVVAVMGPQDFSNG